MQTDVLTGRCRRRDVLGVFEPVQRTVRLERDERGKRSTRAASSSTFGSKN